LRAKVRAILLPIPLDAPVIIAILFCNKLLPPTYKKIL